MEAEALLPQTIKDEKKPSIARRIMPFALVLAVISLGFLVVSYSTTNKSKSTIVTADTTSLKVERSSDTIFIKTAGSFTYNPTPNNLHPTHKPTEEKRMLHQSTHKPTHNHSKPTHKPTKSNPTYTSQPTPKHYGKETYNPTPVDLQPTKKPSEEKRMLHQSTHKPTHNHNKPTHKPTKGNPTYTSQPTPKHFVDDETYNPTPVDLHPTKKPTDDLVLKKQMHN